MSAQVAPKNKVVVIKSQSRAIVSTDDRDFWLEMRSSLLIQVSLIERKLGITRRCSHCGALQLKS